MEQLASIICFFSIVAIAILIWLIMGAVRKQNAVQLRKIRNGLFVSVGVFVVSVAIGVGAADKKPSPKIVESSASNDDTVPASSSETKPVSVAALDDHVIKDTDSDDLNVRLSSIRSVNGMTVAQRIKSCRLDVDRKHSSVDFMDIDTETGAFKKGDVVVTVVFDAPILDQDNPAMTNDLLAMWIIRDGIAIPNGGWADWLQHKPVPIGSEVWEYC